MVAEIVAEMDYLRSREQKLRDTNESTNTRVKWFAFGTMGMLVALGAWQVVYLRAYFRYVDHLQCLGHFANVGTDQSILSRSSYKSAAMGRRGMVELLRLVLLVAVENRYIMTIRNRARSAHSLLDPSFHCRTQDASVPPTVPIVKGTQSFPLSISRQPRRLL
jgi:hypothetical protein